MSKVCVGRVALLLVLGSSAQRAHAAELMASGPAECADTAEIAFRVERSVGMPLAQAAPLSFDVVMERAMSGYVARIGVTAAAPGAARLTRVLSAADCSKLVDAVSVALALALGAADADAEHALTPTQALSAENATSATSPSPAAADAAPAPSPAPDAAEDESNLDDAEGESSAALAPSISIWLLGDAGSLPSPSLGAALGAELEWSKVELRALGTLLFEREARIESQNLPTPGAKLQLVTGGLVACAAPFGSSRAPLAPFTCVGAEIGRVSGVGTGVASPRRGSAFWAAPLLQVGASWTVPDTAMRLAAGLVVAAPLTRDEFALRDIGTIHQAPSVVGRLCMGIGVGFD